MAAPRFCGLRQGRDRSQVAGRGQYLCQLLLECRGGRRGELSFSLVRPLRVRLRASRRAGGEGLNVSRRTAIRLKVLAGRTGKLTSCKGECERTKLVGVCFFCETPRLPSQPPPADAPPPFLLSPERSPPRGFVQRVLPWRDQWPNVQECPGPFDRVRVRVRRARGCPADSADF